MRITTWIWVFVAALFAVTGAIAGQLEPPGPVMATDRVTLNGQQFEPPVTISESGSYVLTSDIRDCLPCDDQATDGIIIEASDVTLDLNGFAVVGAPGNSRNGIVIRPGIENVVVRNGVVRDWDENGIDDLSTGGVRVEGVHASDNGENGIVVRPGSIVRDCFAESNGVSGIAAMPTSVVSHCTAMNNGGHGIVALTTQLPGGSVVTSCAAQLNDGHGIMAGPGTTIADCAVSANSGDGIHAELGSTIHGNSSVANGGDGIEAFDSLVFANTARFNAGAPINATDSTVVNNHVGP